MTTRALALVALVACGAPATRPPITNTTPPAATPAPTVARGGLYGLTTAGLPAVAADGSRVVIGMRESDGARGLPNLTLVVTDRRDVELERHVVLSIAEADTMLDDAEGNNPPLDARVSRANAWLRDRHAVARFVPLRALEVTPDHAQATGDGVTVAWQPSALRITDGARVLVATPTPPSWLPDAGPARCQLAARLGAAAIDRTRMLAVITISYTADSDLCPEPTDQHHVVAW